jgi:hypothetical protein
VIAAARTLSIPSEADFLTELIAEQRAATEELAATRELYAELMGLKAPAEYWTGKSRNHAENEGRYLNHIKFGSVWFVLFSVSVPLLFVKKGLPWIDGIVAGKSFDFGFVYYPLLGLYVLLVTTGLWGLRVLVKLYLSEHHLRTDANERATMITTYLALTEKGSADSSDRSIILSSLFRPTQDGVVKDEGVDVAIPHLLSKYLTQR